MSSDRLLLALDPILKTLQSLDLEDPASAKTRLDLDLPLSNLEAVRRLAVEGMEEGWLLPRENDGVRFGRLAKDRQGWSIDAVSMSGPGPLHRHPKGEVDLLFTLEGEAEFDGHPEGWCVYGPASTHVPTVRGGSMLILYFLPEGAIEFLQQSS